MNDWKEKKPYAWYRYVYVRPSDHRIVVQVPFVKPKLIPVENEERTYKAITRGLGVASALAVGAMIWGQDLTSIARGILFFPSLAVILVLYWLVLWFTTRRYELA